ncbi:crinkler family protein [Gigaspora margarita]|uniref:Crinkler family protein n=1 Tax=Gigaspora margarita TaxID=4874 RepID=A0A8H4ATN3_GIGMA|nr:crinkler family protein [Gigaspora margarita]
MRKCLLKWEYSFRSFDASDQYLVKSGILVIFTAIYNAQSRRILRETLGFGIDGNLLEQICQKEFFRIGMQVLGKNHFLSCDVGAVFECDRYIDFYVDGMNWAIKLLRDGKHIAEHSNRFEPTGE